MAIKTFATGEVLTASDTNTYLANSGLVYVTSTTAGSAVASVTINNCFSSTYDNYKILISGGSSNTPVDLALTLGASATGYYGGVMYHPFTTAGPATVNAVGLNNATSFLYAGAASANVAVGQIELYGPNLAKTTGISTQFAVPNTSGSVVNANGFHNVATAYTGFTITAATGTLTGVLFTVYGYRKA